jgi:hypothetical protein
MTAKPYQHTEKVLNEIARERMRQIKVKGYTPEKDSRNNHSWLYGMMEERMIMTEIHKDFTTFNEQKIPYVREQLIEIAAISAALVEQLDRERGMA